MVLAPGIDRIDARAYAMVQASLAGSLVLCGAAALASLRPLPAFGVLSAGALAHLLLDAVEVKWGNGVHLLAPLSWRLTRFDLVDSDGILTPALTAAGALLLAWELRRPSVQRIGFTRRPGRLAASAALCALYFVGPLALRGAVEASDSYSLRTLRERERRPGRRLGLDRVRFQRDAGGGAVRLWTGETLRLAGALPARDGTVSLWGTFLEPDLLRVDQLAVQRFDRDLPSYAGIALLGLLWLRPRRERAPDAPPA